MEVVSRLNHAFAQEGICRAVVSYGGSHVFGDVVNLPLRDAASAITLVDVCTVASPDHAHSVNRHQRSGGTLDIRISDISALLVLSGVPADYYPDGVFEDYFNGDIATLPDPTPATLD